ncbi:hypothetical protein CSA08_03125 [Candidatus Gracilibacteria bacterium]|nr:MAG: hypothetical protein CSA08_03125 [Candidatus Gracilibacteria bacterium]
MSENSEYVEGSIDYYHGKYKNYKEKLNKGEIEEEKTLTKQEVIRYEGYLKKLHLLAPEYTPKVRKKTEKVIDKKWDEVNIYKNDLLIVFDNHFKAIEKHTGNMPKRAYFDENVGGVTDTPEGLLYPKNNEKFDFITLSRAAKLLGHEIGQHGVSLVSHNELVGNIRGKNNLELAEGTAKLVEDLFEFGENLLIDSTDINGKKVKIINIEKLEYVPNFPKTLMEEILTDKEFLDFLNLNNKVENDKTSPIQRYLRHKRTGFQRKDVTYTIGRIKAAKYYNDIITGKNKSGEFSDLFIAKVGYDQVDEARYLKNKVDEENKLIDKENQKKEKRKLPENLMFHEAVYFTIKQREKRKKENKKVGNEVNASEFYKYMQKKYPFMDFTKEKIDSISFGFKAQLLGAVKMIESAIASHDTEEEVKKILNRK